MFYDFRSHFALVILLSMCLNLQAQDGPKYKYLPREKDWVSYDITTLFLLNQPQSYQEQGWSNGHSISLMKDMLLGRSKFSIAVGIAYTSNNYKSNMRLSVNETTGETELEILNDSISYDRNKVNAKYVEIPVELRYRSMPGKSGQYLRIYLGVKGGIRYTGYSLFENSQSQVRYYHPEALNRWTASTYMRIGYGTMSIFGFYNLLSLYNLEDGVIPNVNKMIPLGVGLSITI